VRRSTDAGLTQPVVAVCSRLVVTGGSHHQLHEELTVAGGELRADGFSRITQVGRLESIGDQSSAHEPSNATFADLRARFDLSQEAIRAATESRSRERLRILETTLERRKQSDIVDITGLLDELAKSIHHELEDAKATQLEFTLWPENERQQLRRDVAALQARLARIPEERTQEIAAIERRYSRFAHRTFPVAITFILPAK
jgi:hypothetical protein